VNSSSEELASSLKLAKLLALLVSSNAARREGVQFSARQESTLRIVS